MSGLVMAVRLDGGPPDLSGARGMAAAAAYRSRGGTHESHIAEAVAIHLDDGGSPRLVPRDGPVRDGPLLLVADARIDNRLDILTSLNLGDADRGRAAQGWLLIEAYRRWGESFADYLIGDFAIALWDGSRRRLVAARDAAGMRPLVHRLEPRRMLVASDAAQLLAAPDVPARPCEPRIAAALAGHPGLPAWTFYDGIQRLPPGHTLVADEAGDRLHEHEHRTAGRATLLRPDECSERLRSRLRDAVAARIDESSTPGLLLSGGMDSTAIAGVAGALQHSDRVAALLVTYSFAYGDLTACDERDVSDLVAGHAGMRNVPVPADDAWPLAEHPEHGPDVDGPDRFQSHVLLDRTLGYALRDGVTVLMTGQWGDQLIGSEVVDYLGCLRQAGLRAAWADLAQHSRATGASRAAVVWRHVLRRVPGVLWPPHRAATLRKWFGGVVRSGSGARDMPAWLRPEAARRFELREIFELAAPRSRLRGEAQRRRHERMLDPQLGRDTEAMERRMARAGMRYAAPWADRRLIELVLRIPQYVIGSPGAPKRLVREAMRGVLPEAARLAAAKRSPQPLYDRGVFDRARTVVSRLMAGSRAAAHGYVDENALRVFYDRALAGDPRITFRERRAFWRFLDVEDWLRRFH